MIERPETSGDHESPPVAREGTGDQDLSLARILGVVAALVAVIVLAAVLMWPLVQGLLAGREAEDPPPSPLPAARERLLPPGPRLEEDPRRSYREHRAWEERMLSGYGAVPDPRGAARVPIERAMEALVERGLGETEAVLSGRQAEFSGSQEGG